MFVCDVLALTTGKYRGFVIWNPCTIAGVLLLLVGSRCSEGGRATGEAPGNGSGEAIELQTLRSRSDYGVTPERMAAQDFTTTRS